MSQQDSIQIKDFPDNFAQNINPLTDDDIKKILKDSTMVAKLCSNPLLVRTNKIEKVEVATVGEKQIDTSSVPPTPSKTKEKEDQVQALNN